MEVLRDQNQDLQGFGLKGAFGDCQRPDFGGGGGFPAKVEESENGGTSRDMWLDDGVCADAGDPSLFYAADDFPALPDFPCMSSSSSTSSTPVPSTAIPAATGISSATSGCSTSSSSSSSAASWAALKSDAELEGYRYRNQHNQVQDQDQDRELEGYRYRNQHNQVRDQDQNCEIEGYRYRNQHNQVQDQDHNRGQPEFIDGIGDGFDCMNVMEDFDCMGINQLIEDSNEIWDPTPLFESDNQTPMSGNQTGSNLFEQFQGDQMLELQQQHGEDEFMFLENDHKESDQKGVSSEDLGMVFFEWLRSNKESISAEDLRSIKIKKSTIESAAKRLGGGKEGMKQLLKLILQWVQNHHLQTKKPPPPPAPPVLPPTVPNPELQNPNPNGTAPIQNPIPHDFPMCFNPPAPWIPPYGAEAAAVPPPPGFPSMVSYIGGHDPPPPYGCQPYHPPPPPPPEYHMLDPAMATWGRQPPPPPGLLQPMAPQGFAGYGSQYNPYQFLPGAGDGLTRMGSSATKEARKKRMARQRRVFTHHHRNQAHQNNPNHQHSGSSHQQMIQGGGPMDANCSVMMGDPDNGSMAHGGWVYWPPAGNAGARVVQPPMMAAVQPHQQPTQPIERPGLAMGNNSQRQINTDKKQGLKTEKNLKFLLQKVLKQSDVGNLGRIVLPKKEAETHLPELEARDGIPIAMEDIGTSRVWNMRYRFWPNNKSRMYLLENTGDFVRSNGLQEGDFIVIYSDVKCGKYMIRGVKVRPQQGSKPEAKKPAKSQKTQAISSPAGPPPLT